MDPVPRVAPGDRLPFGCLRRERDSNPRYRFRYYRFLGGCHDQLDHPRIALTDVSAIRGWWKPHGKHRGDGVKARSGKTLDAGPSDFVVSSSVTPPSRRVTAPTGVTGLSGKGLHGRTIQSRPRAHHRHQGGAVDQGRGRTGDQAARLAGSAVVVQIINTAGAQLPFGIRSCCVTTHFICSCIHSVPSVWANSTVTLPPTTFENFTSFIGKLPSVVTRP